MEFVALAAFCVAIFALCRTIRPVVSDQQIIHVHVWFTKDGEILEGNEWKHGLGDNSDE